MESALVQSKEGNAAEPRELRRSLPHRRLAPNCVGFSISVRWPKRPISIDLTLAKSVKSLRALDVGAVPMSVAGVAMAQTGNMMNGGGWGMDGMGGYGGISVTILLVIVVAGFVAWGIRQMGK